jgi:hypothetical protein
VRISYSSGGSSFAARGDNCRHKLVYVNYFGGLSARLLALGIAFAVVSTLSKPMPLRQIPDEPEHPSADEWGIYDPERTGIAAVRERVEANSRALHAPSAGISRLMLDPHDAVPPASRKTRPIR